jgi:hypothetical protein
MEKLQSFYKLISESISVYENWPQIAVGTKRQEDSELHGAQIIGDLLTEVPSWETQKPVDLRNWVRRAYTMVRTKVTLSKPEHTWFISNWYLECQSASVQSLSSSLCLCL